jgi:hypothetical protein
MPQHRLALSAAQAEKLFFIDIIDSPPPLRVETQPSLAAPEPVEPQPPAAAIKSVGEAAVARRRVVRAASQRPPAPIPLPVVIPPHPTRH